MYSEEQVGNAIDIVIGDDGSKGNQFIETLRNQYLNRYGKVMKTDTTGDYLYPKDMVLETITLCIGDDGFRCKEAVKIMEG